MEPWEAVGFDLKQRWREATGKKVHVEIPEFQQAVMQYLKGDPAKLVEYLRSNTLSPDQQASLAYALEVRDKPAKGRPKSLRQMNIEGLAEHAMLFFRTWREQNDALGINDWGHRGEMKFQACEFAVERLGLLFDLDVDATEIMDLLERPISRRKQG
jgi:hypothetical protein